MYGFWGKCWYIFHTWSILYGIYYISIFHHQPPFLGVPSASAVPSASTGQLAWWTMALKHQKLGMMDLSMYHVLQLQKVKTMDSNRTQLLDPTCCFSHRGENHSHKNKQTNALYSYTTYHNFWSSVVSKQEHRDDQGHQNTASIQNSSMPGDHGKSSSKMCILLSCGETQCVAPWLPMLPTPRESSEYGYPCEPLPPLTPLDIKS